MGNGIWKVIVAVLCLGIASIACAEGKEVKAWKSEDLLLSDKLVKYDKPLRDTALQPFNPKSNAMKGVLEQAAKNDIYDIYITFEGESRETNNWGVSGIYYVVEAYGIKFVEPTKENIEKILKGFAPGSVESQSAVAHAKNSPAASELAKTILARIKKINEFSDKKEGYTKLMVKAYASIIGKQAAPELTKLLKYHELESVKVESGKQLIKLGETAAVEDALKNEKSDVVKSALNKALME